jgi:PAS domain S-box-containing protein
MIKRLAPKRFAIILISASASFFAIRTLHGWLMGSITDFFTKLFNASDWPPRWHCGKWTEFHGWLYIVSDLMIWSAYFTIPFLILRYISKRHGTQYIRLYFLFAAFILACGATHFLDAIAFWIPLYRLNALVRFITGVVSWVTVFYLVKFLPLAFSLKSSKELEAEIERRRLAEEEISKSEERMRLLVEEVKDYAIFMVDSNGCVATWNKGAFLIKGYQADEIIGKPISIFYTEEQIRNNTPEHNLQMARENGRFENEDIRVGKDGSVFWANVIITALYDKSGTLYGYSKVTKDITEQKKAIEKMAYLARLIEDINEAVFSSDAFYHTKSWNKAAEKLFGFTAEEVIGKPINDILRSQASEQDRLHIRAELKENGYSTGEVTYIRKNGTSVHTLMTNTVTTKDNGEVDGYVSICRDITERKKLEQELLKANSEMEAFTYSVSHDLRAPLRRIVGFAHILEEEYSSKLDDEAKRITNVIKDNSLKMGQLIDDLLAFSRMTRQDIVKGNVNMEKLVQEVVADIIHTSPGTHIEWIIDSLPFARADSSLLRQVWINLVSNAVKYSAKTPQSRIEIGYYFENNQTVFFVRDNGIGFNEKYSNKLFRVFQRLHSAEEFEGTGVGLAIAEKIITKHGGRIWATGEEGKGAVFYFSLPGE